jgi:hypothetical protein
LGFKSILSSLSILLYFTFLGHLDLDVWKNTKLYSTEVKKYKKKSKCAPGSQTVEKGFRISGINTQYGMYDSTINPPAPLALRVF